MSNERMYVMLETMYLNWRHNRVHIIDVDARRSPMMFAFFTLMFSPKLLKRILISGPSVMERLLGMRHQQTVCPWWEPRILCGCSETGDVEEPACNLIGLAGGFPKMLCPSPKHRSSKSPKSVVARTHPCLTPLRVTDGSEQLPLNYNVPIMSVWKDSIMLCRLCCQAIVERSLKRPGQAP